MNLSNKDNHLNEATEQRKVNHFKDVQDYRNHLENTPVELSNLDRQYLQEDMKLTLDLHNHLMNA